MKRHVRLGPVGEFVRRRIAATRAGLGLTQKDLGQRAGLPGNTISEIENGARRIDVDDAAAIARALDVDVPYLLGAAPEQQRYVIAEAEARGAREALLRFVQVIEQTCPHEDEHPEGSCEVCDLVFALEDETSARAERAGGDRG